MSFTSPLPRYTSTTGTPPNSSLEAKLARWSEERRHVHQHTCSELARIGGDAATTTMILPGSILKVQARHGRRRSGGIASAVDGTLAQNGGYRRLRRVLLARCKRGIAQRQGRRTRPMRERNGVEGRRCVGMNIESQWRGYKYGVDIEEEPSSFLSSSAASTSEAARAQSKRTLTKETNRHILSSYASLVPSLLKHNCALK